MRSQRLPGVSWHPDCYTLRGWLRSRASLIFLEPVIIGIWLWCGLHAILPVMPGPDNLIRWQNNNLGIITVKLMFNSNPEFCPRNKADARKGGHRCHEDCFLQIFPYNQKQLSKGVAVWSLKVKLLLIQTMGHPESTGKMNSGFLAFLGSVEIASVL